MEIHKRFNQYRIIVRQPRKKWGEELVIGAQSCRRDKILGVFACTNSMNLEDALGFC